MPSFFGGFGVGDALSAAGGIGSLVTGLGQQKASKELLRRQAQFANAQNATYNQVNPLYLNAVQQYAQQLGIGSSPGVNQVGAGHFQLGPAQDRNQFGLGGGYGSMEDQLRLQAGEEDINKYYQQQANQLQHGMRGAPPEIMAAAQARNQSQQGQQYGQFRRGLALNAGQERERKVQQLLAMLGPGLQAGGQAAGIYGQQGAYQGAQAGQSFGALGNILSQYQYGQSLQNHLGQGGGGGYIDPSQFNALNSGQGTTTLDPATGRYVLGGGGTADTYGAGQTPVIDPVTGRVLGYR